jgi:dihydroorotate dehydrogenase
VLELSNKVIRGLHHALANELPIIGAGGILSAEDARSKIAAGADLVQLYTGLIYRGPSLVSECARAIAMTD